MFRRHIPPPSGWPTLQNDPRRPLTSDDLDRRIAPAFRFILTKFEPNRTNFTNWPQDDLWPRMTLPDALRRLQVYSDQVWAQSDKLYNLTPRWPFTLDDLHQCISPTFRFILTKFEPNRTWQNGNTIRCIHYMIKSGNAPLTVGCTE